MLSDSHFYEYVPLCQQVLSFGSSYAELETY